MAGKSDGQVVIDTRIDSSGFDRGLNTVKQKMGAFSGALNKLGSTIKNTFSDQSAKIAGKSYADLQKEIAKAEKQLDKFIEKQIRFVETGGNTKSRSFAGMEYDIEMARNNLEGLRKELSELGAESPRKISFLRKMIDKLKNSFSSLNKTTKSSHSNMLKMLGTSLLFSTVFRTISMITKGFTEGINNLAKYSDEANSTMSALKSSLTQLKNGFAVAFMPLMTLVTPILTKFIDVISFATNKVSEFFAALSGKDTYTKAIAVQEDYAASLKDTANSAKEANKYLSGLDEIRTFTEKNSTKNGTVSPENMFSEESIEAPISKFAKKIKTVIDTITQMLQNGEWAKLGEYISIGIVSGIDYLEENLSAYNWKELGTKIGDFLSGIDWISILRAALELKFSIWQLIAEVWFGAFETAPIETAVITAFGLLNFTGIGQLISSKLISAITNSGFIGTLTTFFVENFSKIFGAGSIFAGVGIAANSFFDMWKEGFSWLKEALMILGIAIAAIGAIILGAPALVVGIIAAIIATVATLVIVIKDNWDIICEFFKNGFEWLKATVRNGLNSISSWWSKTLTSIKTVWTNVWNSMKFTVTNIWNGIITSIKNSINKIIYVINSMIAGMVNGVNSLIYALNSLSFAFPDWIPGLGGKSFGLNIGYVSAPYIPYLASGAVIPPNAPFMAVLGDQKHGTNIEAPLDTIKQAVREVVGGSGGNYHFTAQINRRTLFDEFIEEAKMRQSMTGKSPFELA
jgi:hypothetical protein